MNVFRLLYPSLRNSFRKELHQQYRFFGKEKVKAWSRLEKSSFTSFSYCQESFHKKRKERKMEANKRINAVTGRAGGGRKSTVSISNNGFLLSVFSSFSGIARVPSTSICPRLAPPTSPTATAVPRPQPPKTPLRPTPIPSLPST